MKERVELLVREFRDARRHRLRFEAAVTALSVLVTGSVFWQLRRVGTAISEEGAPPGVPVIETDADPPDQTAEAAETAEDPADWEALLPEFTDESPQQRIAAIAVSQLGYTEGAGEVLLSDDGVSRTGYTRYGAWYGNPYGEWNTMFTYFCMYYAGIEKERIPYGSGCWAWYETLSENGMLTPCGNETEGDIIFFDSDADGEPDRTGIVSGTEKTEDGVQLHVIAGNCEGAVAEKQYLRGGSDMVGVLSVDSYLTEPLSPAESLSPAEAEIILIGYSADSESGIHVDAQAAEGVFPKGTVMKAADVPDEEALQAANDMLGETANIHDAVAVDITFYTAEGEEIEPADGASVSVQISLPAEKQLSDGAYSLLHIDDAGEGVLLTEAAVAADNAAFDAASFSVYVMTSSSPPTYAAFEGSLYSAALNETFTFYEDVPAGSWDSGKYFKVDGNWVDNAEVISPSLYNNDSRQSAYNNGTYKVTPLENGMERHEVTFKASGYDNKINKRVLVHAPSGQELTVMIAPVMVKVSNGYKDVDHIREWLGYYNGNVDGISFGGPDNTNPFGTTNVDGYIPNEYGNQSWHQEPYLLAYDGENPDSVTFYVDSTQNIDISNTAPFRYYNQDGSEISGNNVNVSYQKEEVGNGKYRYYATVVGDKPGLMRIAFRQNDKIDFWLKVWKAAGMSGDGEVHELNHADMEIADGGTYTITETRLGPNGEILVDAKVYDARITYVNDAYVYDKQGNTLRHFTSEPDPEHPVYLKDGTMIGDYEEFGDPNDSATQYELASAWIQILHPQKSPQPDFDAAKVGTSTFNVNMTLFPKELYTYQLVDGELVPYGAPNLNWGGDNPDNPGEAVKLNDVNFDLDHQDVIDALNKCPGQNGLDFTVVAELGMPELPIKKNLIGGNISDDQFTYEIVDLNTPMLKTSEQLAMYPEILQAHLMYETDYGGTPDNNTALGSKYLLERPDISEGALSSFHSFSAFEVFTPDGSSWGNGIKNGDAFLAELKTVYSKATKPFKDCNSVADVFAIVTGSETTEAAKQLFADTAAKYLNEAQASGIFAGNGHYFENQFNRAGYMLVRDQAQIAGTASIQADGTALFSKMRFDLPKDQDEQTFRFALYEKKPVKTASIQYDDSIIYFNVVVKRINGFLVSYFEFLNEDGTINTKMTQGEFTNRVQIHLPDTGGTGPLPYLAVGTLLISAAFALPLIRRRKEDECNS